METKQVKKMWRTILDSCWSTGSKSYHSSFVCVPRLFTSMTEETIPELLPGLNFTAKQQMWLAMTISDCGESTFSEESQTYRLTKRDWSRSRHAGDAFRTLGPLSNSAQFSVDWECPKKSKMNPEKKCTLWGKDL